MSQPIIISQGTAKTRNEFAEQLIKALFTDETDYKSHMDFKLLELAEDKKLISIEQVRGLIAEANIRPRISKNKIILIKEAQALSIEAQNALLKTLEEPPPYCQIILTVDHIDNLLDTVVSRCIVKDLNLTARIDAKSSEFLEAQAELLTLINSDIGAKIDWVSDNKNNLKVRADVLNLLDNWEVAMREKMIESVSDYEQSDIWKDRIKLLQQIKSYIHANANVSLAIETLLLNL